MSPTGPAGDAFLAVLFASPAWTRRESIPELSTPAIQGDTASIHISFPPPRPGTARQRCTFILHRRTTSTSGPIPRWLLADIKNTT